MPTRDEILQAVVERLTVLESRMEQLEASPTEDPWDQPFPSAPPIEGPQAEHVPAPLAPASGEVKASALQRQQFEGEDPEEDTDAVIEARLRIERANAEDLQPVLHQQEIYINPTEGGVTVTVPRPTDQQKDLRREHGPAILANLNGIDPELAAETYVKGGPLWLYTYRRDHVITLPDELKQAMVNDLALSMPEMAHELARDVLKVTDPDTQSMWAHDNMEGVKAETEYGGRLPAGA